MSLLERKQLRGTDELWTPVHALTPLLPYLPDNIWEPALGSGELKKHLEAAGKTVIGTSHDFLTAELEECDAIVTNPPYSLKTAFLERAYELDKPFAFLLPITTLEGRRQEMFNKYGVQVLFLPKRIDFTGKRAPWFAVAWFTWKLDLPSDLTFAQFEDFKER